MANSDNKFVLSITTGTIVKTLAILLAVGFLWTIRDIAALVFVALVLASALDPAIDYLQRYRVPRALGTVVIYILVISIFSSVIAGIAGPIATEVKNIRTEVSKYYFEVDSTLNNFLQNSPAFFTDDRIESVRGGLDQLLVNLTQIASTKGLPVISAIFGGVMSLLLTLVITFYFIVQEGAVKRFISWLVPPKNKAETTGIIEKIQKKLGLWIRGQLLLSVAIFVITFVGLKLLGLVVDIRYAMVLALLAGIFEVIPYLGPILAAIPAVFLSFSTGGWLGALLVAILYIFIQQVENNVLVPKVMAKTIGLNPLIVIISILIGAKIAGVVGAVIAVPVATGVTVYLFEKGFIGQEKVTKA